MSNHINPNTLNKLVPEKDRCGSNRGFSGTGIGLLPSWLGQN